MEPSQGQQNLQQSATFVKVFGILSIIMGSYGFISGAVAMLGIAQTFSFTGDGFEPIMAFFFQGGFAVVYIVPAIFLIISGIVLLREPPPGLVLGLTIATMVVQVVNIVLLVFAIIVLVQRKQYVEWYALKYPSYKMN